MAYSAKAQKNYDDKCKRLTVKYYPAELSVYNTLNTYLTDNKISVNSYLKQLVYNDLIAKGLIKESE